MHESLKRPLFRKKAMEVYQAKQGGKVPGYVIGGLIAPIMAGARVAGPFIARQFARPNVQKGLLGIEAGTAGAGLEETRRGLSGEQSIFGDEPASVAGGLATLAYPGIGTFGRTLPKAFPGSIRAAGAGEAITRKTPFLLPATLLGIPVGMAESQVKGAMKDEKETRVEDPKKAEELKNKLNALGPNATIGQVFNTIDTYDLTDKQKNAAYNQIGLSAEDIKSLRQTKPQGTQPQDQKTGVVGETTSDNAVQKNMMSVMDGGNPNNMSPDEQEKMALKVVDKTNKANREIKNLEDKNQDNDDFKRQFSSLRNQIQSATGNGDMTNLILLKLASGLLTGKTTQRGVGGFLDVLGQASGPTVDTAILLANQQKEFDQSLALALIKSNSEKTGGLKAESKRVYVEELNPNDDLFPVVTRLVPQNKDTGALLDVVQTDQGEAFVPYTKGGKLKEPDSRAKNLSDKSMRDLSVGLEFANIVTNAPPELLGPGATVRQFMDRFSGATQSYQSSIGNFDEFQTKTFNEISDAIMNEEQFKNLSGSSLEKAKEENNKILSQFQKESEKYTADLYKALDSGDQERVARAQLGLIEQRMKYIVANANKAQDRLTAADVKNAEARTKIFTYFDNPKQIKKNYESLATEMNSNFRKQARNYVANGGSKDYVLNMYQNVPVIQDYKIKQAKGEVKAKTKQDYKTVLGTI
jgi:hypothetical protein